MNILKIKDPQGNWVDIPALKGDKGDKGDPGTSPTIDSTLSQANQAADAKVVGDKIDEITLTIDETLTQSGQVADAKVTGDALNTKADQNGYYENLNIGVADQLASKNYIEDNEAYTFRPTGGGAKVGTREFDTIVGGSVVWNQLVQNGNFIDTSHWSVVGATFSVNNNIGSFTAQQEVGRISQVFSKTSRHIYLFSGEIKTATETTNVKISGFFNGNIDASDAWQTVSLIVSAGSDGTAYVIIQDNRVSDWDEIKVKNILVFDLTTMFGSTIADYIYSLEQATAGAGVAWFRKHFPNDYYDYNPGELMHVTALQSHDTVGFNLWDEEWELGYYNTSNGTKVSEPNNIRCKNKIKVIPNTRYFIQWNKINSAYINIQRYDVNGNFISNSIATAPLIMEVADNVGFITFYMTSGYGTTYKNDICINLSWSGTRNGEYEPYAKHSYPLDSSLILRGIPKLTADGDLTYDGDIYKPDGSVERRYGIVDLGTLAYNTPTDNRYYTGSIASLIRKQAGMMNIACTKFKAHTGLGEIYNITDGMWVSVGGNVSFSKGNYASAADFKAAMSGVYLVYELAEPTTEQSTPYQSPQIIDPYGTEEYVTTSIIPVGHQTQYPEDLRAKIESLPWDFANLIAPVETTYIATRNYTSGSLFIVDNILYKATANIANGGAITPNTNCIATTLAEIIAAL